jgi:hypothetical protein
MSTAPGPRRALALGIALAALLVTILDHVHGYRLYLERLNTARTLLPDRVPESGGAALKPLARRVVVLFLDGLGFEASRALPALSEAAARGVRRPLTADFPSFTYPAVVAFATGVPPLYSGLRINAAEAERVIRERPLPSLLDGARRAGLPVRIFGGGWETFRELLDPDGGALEVDEAALLAAPVGGRSLDWLYFGAIDQAGHAHGGDSPEYRAAAAEGDRLAARALAAVDLSKDAVVIVSDHGHLPRGGHGGDEPEVAGELFLAVGAGVAPRGDADGRAPADVAPTISALLGLATPAAGLGRPMLDILDAPPEAWAERLAPALEARLRVEAALTLGAISAEAPALAARLERGEAGAISATEAMLDDLAARRAEVYAAARRARATPRLALAAALSALLLAGICWLHRRGALRLAWRDLLPTAVYAALFFALYYGTGYGLSWSIPRGSPGFLVETLLYGGGASAAALLISRRRRFARLAEETLVMTLAFGVPYLLSAAWAGLDPAYLADPRASFLVLVAATAGFYAHGPFGLLLLIRNRRPIEDGAHIERAEIAR